MDCLLISGSTDDLSLYSYYQDWYEGFVNHPNLNVNIIETTNIRAAWKTPLLKRKYDFIVFLHSTYPTIDGTRKIPMLKRMLTGIGGVRVFFLNNEFKSWQDKLNLADYLGARFLISQLTLQDAQSVYETWPHQILSLPYGLNPQVYKPQVPVSEREIDIGFRGDYYASYVGHNDRNLLLDEFNAVLKKRYPNMRVDIEVGERYGRQQWAEFLNRCVALVGHEAGMTRVDKDENIRNFINAQEVRLDADRFRKLVDVMRETGVFDPPPSGRIAAPRNFDAMGTKTLQILLPGRYNDLFQPGTHYVELQRDMSNLDDVVEILFDEAARNTIVERAYQDGLAHHTYEQRINQLVAAIS
jgi:spore maturation protein CgeB